MKYKPFKQEIDVPIKWDIWLVRKIDIAKTTVFPILVTMVSGSYVVGRKIHRDYYEGRYPISDLKSAGLEYIEFVGKEKVTAFKNELIRKLGALSYIDRRRLV